MDSKHFGFVQFEFAGTLPVAASFAVK